MKPGSSPGMPRVIAYFSLYAPHALFHASTKRGQTTQEPDQPAPVPRAALQDRRLVDEGALAEVHTCIHQVDHISVCTHARSSCSPAVERHLNPGPHLLVHADNTGCTGGSTAPAEQNHARSTRPGRRECGGGGAHRASARRSGWPRAPIGLLRSRKVASASRSSTGEA